MTRASLCLPLLVAVAACSKSEQREAERAFDKIDHALEGRRPAEVLERLPGSLARDPGAALDDAARAARRVARRMGFELDGGTWQVLGDAADAFPANPIVGDWLERGRSDPIGTLSRALETLPTDGSASAHETLRALVGELEPLRRTVDGVSDDGLASAPEPRELATRLSKLADDFGRFELTDPEGATRAFDVVRIDETWLPSELAADWVVALDRLRERIDRQGAGRLDAGRAERLSSVVDRLERDLGTLIGADDEATLRARLEAALSLTPPDAPGPR